jgi:predicted kinase
MTRKAIITVGISGSGKSTFARELCENNSTYIFNTITTIPPSRSTKDSDWIEINRDNLRFNYETPDWTKYKFTKGKENAVTKQQEDMVFRGDSENMNIIISDTNLNPKTRNKWINLLKSLDYEVEIKEFPITWEEAIKRNAQREGGVTPTVLYKQWKQWLKYLSEDGRHKFYTPNWSDPLAVIIDIDGTVAQMVNRHPKVDQDVCRDQILHTVWGLVEAGYTPIYLSGRDGQCEYDTLQWLEDNGFPFEGGQFFIRPEGNSEKDTIIKERIFWEHLADNFNVQIAIDDRPCVVSMWNDIGIPCVMAVADQRNWF